MRMPRARHPNNKSRRTRAAAAAFSLLINCIQDSLSVCAFAFAGHRFIADARAAVNLCLWPQKRPGLAAIWVRAPRKSQPKYCTNAAAINSPFATVASMDLQIMCVPAFCGVHSAQCQTAQAGNENIFGAEITKFVENIIILDVNCSYCQ